jgi:hypothetical protein
MHRRKWNIWVLAWLSVLLNFFQEIISCHGFWGSTGIVLFLCIDVPETASVPESTS